MTLANNFERKFAGFGILSANTKEGGTVTRYCCSGFYKGITLIKLSASLLIYNMRRSSNRSIS
jgi:hypothetical protein